MARFSIGHPAIVLVVAFVSTVGASAWMVSPPAPNPGSSDFGTSGPVSRPISDTTEISISSFNSTEQLPSSFWGTTALASVNTSKNTTSLELGATPARELVWPGGSIGDQMDTANSTIHESGGGIVTASTTAAWFVNWCRSIGCHAIFQVPGEIDSPSTGANMVRYVEGTLRFFPDYWEIGNEPALWQHFGVPWSEWSSKTTPAPSPSQYAGEVNKYIAAMRAVDQNIQMVGLPGIGHGSHGETSWISDTVSENGQNLSAVAIHVYPAGRGPTTRSNATLPDFYGTLTDSASLPGRVPADLTAIQTACTKCSIRLLATEFGSAVTGGLDSPFVSGFPQAPYIAAELAQAVALNLTDLVYFAVEHNSSGSWFPVGGTSRPVYALYTEIFSRLGSDVLPTTVATSVGGVYALATEGESSPVDLLVVNVNATNAITFSTRGTGLATSGPIETWSWNDSTSEPMAEFWPQGLPPTWTTPAGSLVLFEQPKVESYPLTITETGIPSLHRWFLTVGDTTETTNSSHLTFFLPNGEYTQTLHGTENLSAGTRIALSLPPTVSIAGSAVAENASFGLEYLLTTSSSPESGGITSPSSQWVPQGTEATVAATSASNFSFQGWQGSGPGSYTGSANPARLLPTGPVVEVGVFHANVSSARFPVNFNETGLPAGTPWGVIVGSLSLSGTSSELSTSLPNATYPFTVSPLANYTATPSTGSVTVSGTSVTQNISFSPIPEGKYRVWFNESGLMAGTEWSVNLSGSSESSTTPTVAFTVPNGTYPYDVKPITGYLAAPDTGSVKVSGVSAAVPVVFSVVQNATSPIWFNETGLPGGSLWSVSLGQTLRHSTSISIRFDESPGTYPFSIAAVGNRMPSPAEGNLSVPEVSRSVMVTFVSEYALTFDVPPGAPSGTWWNVTLGPVPIGTIIGCSGAEVTRNSTGPTIGFLEPNGTYSFSVKVAGFPHYDGNGTVSISGGPVVVTPPSLPSTNPGPPGGAGSSPLYLLVAVLGIAAIGSATASIALLRRRRRPPA